MPYLSRIPLQNSKAAPSAEVPGNSESEHLSGEGGSGWRRERGKELAPDKLIS